jgi:hypothetical protein
MNSNKKRLLKHSHQQFVFYINDANLHMALELLTFYSRKWSTVHNTSAVFAWSRLIDYGFSDRSEITCMESLFITP